MPAYSPRKPDLHEGAVEERPLGDDEIGAEAAGNDLLSSSQLLLGKFQAEVQLVQVTPATRQIHSFSTESNGTLGSWVRRESRDEFISCPPEIPFM